MRFNIDLHGGIVDTDDPATLRSTHLEPPVTSLRLFHRGQSGERSLDLQFGDMLTGLTDLTNRFLDQAGLTPFTLRLPGWSTPST